MSRRVCTCVPSSEQGGFFCHHVIIAAHRPYGLDCRCGFAINSDQSWASHLIAALAECGLTVTDLPVEAADCDENGFCLGCLVDSQPHSCGFTSFAIPPAWRRSS